MLVATKAKVEAIWNSNARYFLCWRYLHLRIVYSHMSHVTCHLYTYLFSQERGAPVIVLTGPLFLSYLCFATVGVRTIIGGGV